MEKLDTVKIKGKEYATVATRIKYFNENYPNGCIYTERTRDEKMEIFKAVIVPDVDNPSRIFVGHSQAVRGDGYINKTSALENCETSAIGRALGFMGIGTEGGSIASAEEVKKAQMADKEDYEHVFRGEFPEDDKRS